ncbi:MAG TPA: RebB family R body protein [Bryobacteraceae bacterium]|jgi:hypothetical protein
MNPTESTNTEAAAAGAALAPNQIIDYNRAFSESLQLLQTPVTLQRTQILSLIVDILDQLIKLSGEAQNIHPGKAAAAIENLKRRVEEAMKATAAPSHETVNLAGTNDWFQNLMRALGVAQDNTVATQQQLNIIANAALTEGLAALLNIVQSDVIEGAPKA